MRRLPSKPKEGKVDDYLVDHRGIENSQFFTGAGVSHTKWDMCYVGVGDNPNEALNDALDAAADSGWDVQNIKNEEPYTPSVSGTVEQEQAAARPEREEGEDDDTYEARCADGDSEIETGWSDNHYYTVLYLKGAMPRNESMPREDGELPGTEDEDPRARLRRLHSIKHGGEWPETFPDRDRVRWMQPRHGSSVDSGAWLSKRAANNTYLLKHRDTRYGNVRYTVRLHNTDVLRFLADGSCVADASHFHTLTTRERMNAYLPKGWHIHVRQGTWWWDNQRWPRTLRDAYEMAQRSRSRRAVRPTTLEFQNGDQINRAGDLVRNGTVVCTSDGVIVAPPAAAAPPVQEGAYQKELEWINQVRERLGNLRRAQRWNSAVENIDKPSKKKTRMNLH